MNERNLTLAAVNEALETIEAEIYTSVHCAEGLSDAELSQLAYLTADEFEVFKKHFGLLMKSTLR